jgi:hypothetical protein
VNAPPLSAPYLAAVAVLGVAGLAKVSRPDYTARALHEIGVRAGRSLVRAGAVAETAVAVAALVAPSPMTSGLVALSYAAFTAFTALAVWMRWPISSCGCFGKPDTIPTVAHAALNAGAVICAVGWAMAGPSNLADAFSRQPWHGAPLGLETAVIALLAYFVWTTPASAVVRGGRRP